MLTFAFTQGIFQGTTTKQLSLKHILDTQSISNEKQKVTYEITRQDGTTEVLDLQVNELSMYYTDISTNRASPGMMEIYKNTMPKIIQDLLPYKMNDFSKYVSFPKISTNSITLPCQLSMSYYYYYYIGYFSFSMIEKLHGLNKSDVPGPNI
jgi:hypothetical protein